MEAQNRTTPAISSSELITTPSTGPRGPVPALSPLQWGRSPTRPSTSTVSGGKPGGRSLRPYRAGA
jgi:hypothetical protein